MASILSPHLQAARARWHRKNGPGSSGAAGTDPPGLAKNPTKRRLYGRMTAHGRQGELVRGSFLFFLLPAAQS